MKTKKNLFADKEKTRAQANIGKGREPRTSGSNNQSRGYDKGSRPNPDPTTIKNLQDAVNNRSKTWDTPAFEAHKTGCHKATFKTNSNRLCFWCIDEGCLKRRGDGFHNAGDTNCLDAKNGEKYITWRIRMDANTANSYSNYAGLQSRFKPGVKAGKAATDHPQLQTPSYFTGKAAANHPHLQTPSNFASEETPQTFHCHRSCAAFTNSPCAQPEACKEKRLSMAACPIK